MAATVSSVRALSRSGEFDDVDPTVIEGFITEAGKHIGERFWVQHLGQDGYDRGHSLLAAHLLKLDEREDDAPAPGSLWNERIGPASRTHYQPKMQEDPLGLMQTKYGQRFISLRATLPVTGTAVFVPRGCR